MVMEATLYKSRVVAFSHSFPSRHFPAGQSRFIHRTRALFLNRFLFDPNEVGNLTTLLEMQSSPDLPTVVLPSDDYRTIHAATILKLRNGDSIRAGIVGGCDEFPTGQYTDQATIEWIPEAPNKKAQILANGKPPGPLKISLSNLTSAHPHDKSNIIPVSLILALPRPLQLGRILPMISQLGVDQLVLTSAQKVPKDYFGSHLFRKPQVLREKLIEGLCQSGDVVLPKVTVSKNVRDFLKNELDELFPPDEYARVIAHPQRHGQGPPLRMQQIEFPVPRVEGTPSKIVIAVGPEGGWTEPEELDLFTKSHCFQQVTMGSRTLRTDCAVVGLLSLAHEVCFQRNTESETRKKREAFPTTNDRCLTKSKVSPGKTGYQAQETKRVNQKQTFAVGNHIRRGNMSDAIASVIVASAQSVAKVFVIGSIGYGAVKFPRNAPLLPRSLVGTVARFTFHTFTLSLIYSTIAVAVSPSSLGNYWFLIVGGWVVLGTSYLVATVLRFFFPINNKQDFVALRVATTFPNIVALPILIFPSLCEFPVVYKGYATDYANMSEETDGENITSATLRQECVAQSNTMIFCYFIAWSFAFWSFGYPQLMQAAKENRQNHQVDNMQATAHDEVSHRTSSSSKEGSSPVETKGQDEELFFDTESPNANHSDTSQQAKEQTDMIDEVDERKSCHVDESETIVSTVSPSTKPCALESSIPERAIKNEPLPVLWWTRIWLVLHPFWQAIKQTTTSPGFIAMVLAFVTACIPPLQRALFEPAGPLRFIGSAVEALGTASSPISTMVVAASLVPPQQIPEDNTDPDHRVDNDQNDGPAFDERPGMTDPNFGPYQRPTRRHRRSSRFQDFRRELRSSSIRILNAVPRSTPEMRRLHIWFSLSRLILAPAVVVGLILAFDCSSSTILNSVPNLAKLVIIVNASLPGALIIVVLLKAKEECAETAAAVSKVYLPSYLLSIFTIAGWCAVGLWITLPDKEGRTFCQQI